MGKERPARAAHQRVSRASDAPKLQLILNSLHFLRHINGCQRKVSLSFDFPGSLPNTLTRTLASCIFCKIIKGQWFAHLRAGSLKSA